MKKRLLSLILVGTMMLGMVACGKTKDILQNPIETENSTETNEVVSTENLESTEIEDTTQQEETPADSQVPSKSEESSESESKVEQNKPVSPYTYTDLDKTMYAKSSVNVRNLPSTDGEKLGGLSKAQEVHVTGQCKETGWYKIIYSDSVGYVSNNYLLDTKPVEETYDGIIQREEGVSLSMVKGTDNYYKMIPETIRNHFENSDWRIIISNQSLKDRFDISYNILACTRTIERVIYIDNRTSAQKAIIHEMGHYLDIIRGWDSNSQEFSEIYNAEVEIFKSIQNTDKNNTNTSTEYFAEFFEVMILNPESVRQSCPRTYDFIMLCIEAIN